MLKNPEADNYLDFDEELEDERIETEHVIGNHKQ